MIQPSPGENMGDTREGDGTSSSVTGTTAGTPSGTTLEKTLESTIETAVGPSIESSDESTNLSTDVSTLASTTEPALETIVDTQNTVSSNRSINDLNHQPAGADHVSNHNTNLTSQNVFELNPRKVYSITEVDRILPIVRRITQEYVEKVQVLMARFESAKGRHDHKLPQIEREINEAVQSWQSKLEKLGLKTKGLWIADFDSGDGYFCWKYPEEKVNFWHQYHDGFGGRVKIDREKLTKTAPPTTSPTEKPLDMNP